MVCVELIMLWGKTKSKSGNKTLWLDCIISELNLFEVSLNWIKFTLTKFERENIFRISVKS